MNKIAIPSEAAIFEYDVVYFYLDNIRLSNVSTTNANTLDKSDVN